MRFSTRRVLVSFGAALISLGLCSAQELSEGNASEWGTFAADGAPAWTTDEAERVKVGRFSIRFETESGFDTGVTHPADASAHWDLSDKNFLDFRAYAINPNSSGFQGNQPVVVLNTPTGSIRLEPDANLMFDRAWHHYRVPLDGDERWTRTDTGTPDITDVNQLEIHQDTWDTGFVVYYDGVEFVQRIPGMLPPPGPPPPPGVDPDQIRSNVLLFIFDPIMENKGGMRMHETYGWFDPVLLAEEAAADLRTSSHGKAQLEIRETLIVDDYPFFEDGFRYDDGSYDEALASGDWHSGRFDYARFLADANLAKRVERGEIDEVWVYGAPGFEMWESTMAGDGGYWCNSPPVRGVPSERVFVVMGLNFERGVAEAIHSWGHRAESVMIHSYGPWEANRDTTWNAFTLLDKDAPSLGSIGNVHFPVNGESDYDYANPRLVLSDADEWYAYPDLSSARRFVNFLDWSPDGADPHRQYLKWWYDHMPHMPSRGYDFFLANWWRYLVDVEQFKGWDGNLYYSSGVPTASILAPADGALVSNEVAVEVAAEVDGAIGRVDLYVDDVYHSTDSLAPFQFVWDASGETLGEHTLQARAFELQNGAEGISTSITVSVSEAPSLPSEVSPPGAAEPLLFETRTLMVWEPAERSGSERFHLYRGNVAWLSDGAPAFRLKVNLEQNSAQVSEDPWPGSIWYYIVTGVNRAGEGPRGTRSSGAPR